MGYDQISEAAAFLRESIAPVPDVAVVLGSGLGDFASGLTDSRVLPYGQIPNWPVSKVVGHAGQLVVGGVGAKRVIALSGRSHFYEGYPMETVTFATRVLGRLGVKTLILTNAAGGINLKFSSGALMIISDHINLMGTNPLVGPNDDRFGVRFPDMTNLYSPRLRGVAHDVAKDMNLPIEEGVYVAVHGPSYETPAEIRAFRTMGADAVGMSTAPEAIVARHMGVEVLGLSCITNMAAGVLPQALVHDEVMETARRVRGNFIGLLEGVIGRL